MNTLIEPTFDEEKAFIKSNEGEYQAGNNAVVWKEPTLPLASIYNYTGSYKLGYKIPFSYPYTEDISEFKLKPRHGDNIVTSTLIQNLAWLEGLAPRVLDIVRLKVKEKYYYAQVIELLPTSLQGPWTQKVLDKAKKFRDKYHVNNFFFDEGPWHCFTDYFVDFSDAAFVDKEAYIQDLYDQLVDLSDHSLPYQAVPALDFDGVRKIEERVPVLQLDSFEDKDVLVYGSNGGATCREVAERGARKVIGLDKPEVVKAAYQLDFLHGMYNIDYEGGNFQGVNPDLGEFDVVFFLACFQIGFPKYIRDICKELLIVEGHKGHKREDLQPLLEEHADHVEFLGMVEDNGTRPVFRCFYD